MSDVAGHVTEISGWVVRARAAIPLALREVVLVGHERLIGEVIALARDEATIQVYEETEGVAPGDPLYATGEPLSIELGPGLLGGVFDGVQRPLESWPMKKAISSAAANGWLHWIARSCGSSRLPSTSAAMCAKATFSAA